MGEYSAHALRQAACLRMRALAATGLGSFIGANDGPKPRQRDVFVLSPGHSAARHLTERPRAANFIRAERGGLLFRNATKTLANRIPSHLRRFLKQAESNECEFNWRGMTPADLDEIFAAVREVAGLADAPPAIIGAPLMVKPAVPEAPPLPPATEGVAVRPAPRRERSLRYKLEERGVDPSRALLYCWSIYDPDGGLRHRYIGKAEHGAHRPLTHYERNVRNLLGGLPYRKGKPDGYRRVHRRLADAVEWSWPIQLEYVCNVDDVTEIFAIEARYTAELNHDEWPAYGRRHRSDSEAP
jgi:hypothetical protein